MAASSSSQLSVLASSLRSTYTRSSAPVSTKLRLLQRPDAGSERCPLGNLAIGNRVGSKRGQAFVVRARRTPRGKDRNGGVAEAVDADVVEITEWKGRKLQGLEPDFWEGEKWNTFGFIMQYLWAFGVLVSLGACGVAVATYNGGATDIRETAVYKEAMENGSEADSYVDDSQDFPEMESMDAPSLQ